MLDGVALLQLNEQHLQDIQVGLLGDLFEIIDAVFILKSMLFDYMFIFICFSPWEIRARLPPVEDWDIDTLRL